MDNTNRVKNPKAKAPNAAKARDVSPKLTVAQIVEKFVTPSSHRKFIQLSEPGSKTNKK
jgi:hypothetical protein